MAEQEKKRDTSRWTDNPFRSSNLTPEQRARIDERDRVIRHFRETGDPVPAQEAGWFPSPEKKRMREAAKAKAMKKARRKRGDRP